MNCFVNKCSGVLFKCILDLPEITSYLLQSTTLAKLHIHSSILSIDHSSTGSHFLWVFLAVEVEIAWSYIWAVGCGRVGMFFFDRNPLIESAVWAGALLWCSTQSPAMSFQTCWTHFEVIPRHCGRHD
jgi:hypothetical protein